MDKEIVQKIIEQDIDFFGTFESLAEKENNLGCVDGKIIGTGRADYTQGSTEYNLKVKKKQVVLIDIPGIEGDESLYEEDIKKSLEKAHIIFYVNGSGKKIEKATLEKIQKYMHDGTSVFSISNVHCKAKKERIEGIDKTFSEELDVAFDNQKEIVSQTEKELQEFLGNNFCASVSVNGLMSFCSLATQKDGATSIIDEKDKRLRSDQRKYAKEYSGSMEKMKHESRILEIKSIIDDKVDNQKQSIYDENIKKLKNRLEEMIKKIQTIHNNESEKIRDFIKTYDEFESNCYNAKEDCLQSIRHIGASSVEAVFATVKEELFGMIEQKKGKTDSKEIQKYFENRKNQIVEEIQNNVNKKLENAQTDYAEAIEDAQQRLLKDMQRAEIKFEVSLQASNVSLDDSFGNALKYNLKDLGENLFKIGELIFSGAMVGAAVPVIGSAIGAVVGAVLGILSSIWNFFASETTRINKAKEKLDQAINEQIYDISNKLKKEIVKLNYDEIVNDSYNQIYEMAEKQKKSLKRVIRLMDNVLNELRMNYRKVS